MKEDFTQIFKPNQHQLLINDCHIVPVSQNKDNRGCLYEIYRKSWEGSFSTVQWNACVSNENVIRGVHVHVDYDEFYTLPKGKVLLGLSDIRRDSTTFGKSVTYLWSSSDGVAIVVPKGVAHVVFFIEDSVLAFGLSDYWKAELDVVGCQWNDPKLGFNWEIVNPLRSDRDSESCSYDQMISDFETKSRSLSGSGVKT